jgi:glycine/D-amino acid oxidase-like deaminating enzyme/nitrite reductase/ring-hydroxylating ferredoxin subunit
MAGPDTAAEAPAGVSSPWLRAEPPTPRAPLAEDTRTQVCVVGAGIAGASTALELRRAGVDVVLLEARRIGFGVTGHTTAKLSSLQGTKYSTLRGRWGSEVARTYAAANQAGVERIAGLVEELGIECGFRRKPAFTYTESDAQVSKIENEVDAAVEAGLPVTYTEESDLPFAIRAAARCEDQAEFDPVAYVRAIVEEAERAGVRVHEDSRVTSGTDDGVIVETGAAVSADHVVVATQLPFIDRGLLFARLHPERSYALGVRVDGQPPQGMYLSVESPTRSMRSHPLGDGELLIVGGESHKAGQGNAGERYAALERYARERFAAPRTEYRWAAHDFISPDRLPMIGRLPFARGALCVAGMGKWGLAMSATAGRILTDIVRGAENPWEEVFDPRRMHLSSLPEVVKENANVGWRFFGDRIRHRSDEDGIAPGEGRVVGAGLEQRAVYRDENGAPHRLSARCTHLGCIVDWNSAEKTWDCPCHGSRFGARGEVIAGPATAPLPRED